jgi:hypothetical protein
MRFHGGFGLNAKLRSGLVPKKEPCKLLQKSAKEFADAEQAHLFGDELYWSGSPVSATVAS